MGMMSNEHELTLESHQIEQIIDALIFSNCCDVCADGLEEGNYREQLNRLELAKLLKDTTGIDCSDKLYIFGNDFEDKKGVDFIRESFNIRSDN
jgi:hypothetical protein